MHARLQKVQANASRAAQQNNGRIAERSAPGVEQSRHINGRSSEKDKRGSKAVKVFQNVEGESTGWRTS